MKRILFVDDESKILDGIRRMLHSDRTRWDMQFAVGGEAALKACEAGSFDVVISDMRMPGMDGAALLSEIRDRFPASARIILSGQSDPEAASRAIPVAHRFLAKPCNAIELQSTIDRVCALQEVLGRPELRQVVGAVGELPSLSGTYISLTKAVSDESSTIENVAHIVERDIAMSAKILQLVNSAFFGLAQKVTNLRAAVSYLGMDTIRNLVLVADTFKAFVPDRRIHPGVMEGMAEHAQRVAVIAAELPVAKNLRDATIIAALLHDVGKLILASRLPEQFCAVQQFADEKHCDFFEAEEQVLGTSHAEIGAYLLGLWGIPHLAVEAIAHHHHPTRIPYSGWDSAVAVYVADLLDGCVNAPSFRDSDKETLATLGLLTEVEGLRQSMLPKAVLESPQ
ncbi:MAG: HDOD domain-containing protein [Acidobacteria bacterium]|nr:HDOD domain-containing protein [Acidobacteriota bacterium]